MTGKENKCHKMFRLPAALLVCLFLCAALTAGCSGPSKYEVVNLETLGQGSAAVGAASGDAGTATLSTDADPGGEAPAAGPGGESGDASDADSGGESGESPEAGPVSAPGEAASEGGAAAYEDVDEVVVVTADVANVRESEGQNAKIFAQLKRGSTLRRTGVAADWSRVTYQGETAYVASNLIQAQEPADAGAGADGAGDPQGAAAENAGSLDGAGADEAAAASAGNELAQAMDGMAATLFGRAPETTEEPFDGHIVAIDAGRQAKANVEKEPIGPDADTMRAKMPEGATGTATGIREYELTLQISQRLKKRLEESGYRVVMIRDSNDVNLSNAERSQLAARGGADILIRLYANSLENSSIYGALSMCMTDQNPYNADLHGKSYALSKKIVDSICGQTGTKNRGVQEVDSMSEINWSKIPVSVVKMGFLSNPDEDRWMCQEAYQDKIAEGIRAAVDSYFAEAN